VWTLKVQGVAEITPTFGCVTARAVEGIQWWEWSRWLAAVLPFSDDAMGWSGEHRGFVVETFFKNNESVNATQRAFRRHFRLGRRAPVPDRKTILLWVSNMRAIGTLEQLKEAIRQEVAAIPPAITRKGMDNFRERLQQCVINNGRHLSYVIFKSV